MGIQNYIGKVNFIRMISKYNFSSRKNSPISYIVVHDTGNKRNGANAIAHAKYFSREKLTSSAHYFVDDKNIVQVVDDENASWHCGDGKNKYGINNCNSIGVEICINGDSDVDKAIENTIFLVVYLLENYNLNIENVKRHFDASKKICPRIMSENDWKLWKIFLKNIENNINIDCL